MEDLFDHKTWDKWHEDAVKSELPRRNESWCSNRAMFSCYTGSMGRKYNYQKWPCYGSVNYGGYTHGYLFLQDQTEEMLRPYLQWLVNESVFADIFLSKNVERIIEKGFIVDDTKHKGLVLGGLIATRFTWEHALHAGVWWELVKAGCNKDYAYIIACSHKAHAWPVQFVVPSYVNHGGIDTTTWNKKAVEAWMKHTPLSKPDIFGANSTFQQRSCKGATVYEDFGIPKPPRKEIRSSFSSISATPIDEFVAHFAGYEEEFIKQVIPDYKSGVTLVYEKPKPPQLEPEEDM